MTDESSENLDPKDELALYLAANHYNVSLAHSLPFKLLYPGKERIFKQEMPESYFEFRRNILLIGAGASKNVFDFIQIASKVLEDIYTEVFEVKLETKMSKLILNKFRQIAGYHNNKVYDESSDITEIMGDLTFEGGLSLLLHFIKKEDLINIITKKVGYKFLPSLFYEIVAHLFKHRYIDVVVNFNFDELADNAIEDEMGVSTFHRIIDDSNCKPLGELMDNEERLRIPIYIKPHGTIHSQTSMLFTLEQYLDLSANMKQLLNEIFNGNVGSKPKVIKKFNIIMAGYGFNDLDMQYILFNQLLSQQDCHINYFIFDKNATNFYDDFSTKLKAWIKVLKITKYIDSKGNIKEEEVSNLLSSKASFFLIPCNSDPKLNEIDDNGGLAINLKSIYDKIRTLYEKPYQPGELTRHVVLSKLFPRNGISNNGSAGNEPKDLFIKRAHFYALYDFLKYKGNVPINVLTSDRAGKYYSLYLDNIKGPDASRDRNYNLIGYLTNKLGARSMPIVLKNSHLYCEKFYKSEISSGVFDECLLAVVRLMQEATINKEDLTQEEYVKEIIKFLKEGEIFNKRTNEINAIYNDPKHGRFYPFTQENIIVSNLELTWRFFDFITNNSYISEWDFLLDIDSTGKAIYNLHDYADSSYLTDITRLGKKIYLLYNNQPSRAFSQKLGREVDIIDEIDKICNPDNPGSHGSFFYKLRNYESHMHQMALFVKKEGSFLVPKFGIYFFKPANKVRINPVCFYNLTQCKNEMSAHNLEMMFQLFKDAIDTSGDVFKTEGNKRDENSRKEFDLLKEFQLKRTT